MKAVVITRPGDVDVLEIREVQTPPAPTADHVKVRVRAAGLNRADICHARTSWNSIKVNRASTTQSFAASEFCSGKTKRVAQNPK